MKNPSRLIAGSRARREAESEYAAFMFVIGLSLFTFLLGAFFTYLSEGSDPYPVLLMFAGIFVFVLCAIFEDMD